MDRNVERLLFYTAVIFLVLVLVGQALEHVMANTVVVVAAGH